MKKALIILLTILLSLFGRAQSKFDAGIKAGVNFASAGELKSTFFNFNNITLSEGTNLEFGYHLGIFGKLQIDDKFYFRPELVFTKRQHQYDITGSSEEENLNLSSIDVPLLMGLKISGPVSLFIGPSFHYIIDKSIESRGQFNSLNIENDFVLGINMGVALSINRFVLDIRYERSFGENLLSFQSDIYSSYFGTINTQSEQIILSLSYKIF